MPKFGGAVAEPICQEITPSVSATSSSKRASPNNDVEDMDVPLKMLKRRIKIKN